MCVVKSLDELAWASKDNLLLAAAVCYNRSASFNSGCPVRLQPSLGRPSRGWLVFSALVALTVVAGVVVGLAMTVDWSNAGDAAGRLSDPIGYIHDLIWPQPSYC